MDLLSKKRFLATNLITIITLFTLILAGGIVRSSGSGMGCPDWPKCFDQYVPPTDITQLPAGYQLKYVTKRIAKNEHLAKTLDRLGYKKMAYRIRHDLTIQQPEVFNAIKTWTEYLNRVIGAVCGLFLVACSFFSWAYIRSAKRIFFLSFGNVLLVVFQAWLGSLVVSTNLLSWTVTVHMLVALLILAISIYTYFYALYGCESVDSTDRSSIFLSGLSIFVLLLTLMQVVLGTEVREQIDFVATTMSALSRSEWVSKVGFNSNFHRDMAILVLVLNSVLFGMIRRHYQPNELAFRYGVYILLLVFLQILIGAVLYYLSLPPIAQAMHILLASLLFGAQFYLILLMGRNKIYLGNE